MTHGNSHNIKCPWCGKVNHYVTLDVTVPHDRVTEFKRDCTHCKQRVRYSAAWAIEVDAERDGKAK